MFEKPSNTKQGDTCHFLTNTIFDNKYKQTNIFLHYGDAIGAGLIIIRQPWYRLWLPKCRQHIQQLDLVKLISTHSRR